MNSIRTTFLALAAGATVMSLAACNDSDNSMPAMDTTPTPSGAPAPTPSPTPLPGEAGRFDQSAPAGSTVEVSSAATCLVCSVPDAELGLIVDGQTDTFATASLSVNLLASGGEDLTVTVTLPEAIDPAVADEDTEILANKPGFLVSFPDSELLSIAVLPVLEISALKDGAVVSGPEAYGFGFFDSLALGTLLQDINNTPVYLGVDTDAEYDAIRLTFSATLAGALLNVQVHEAGVAGAAGSVSGDF